MRYRDERRPSSTTIRRRCVKYWVQPDGHMRCQNPHCRVLLHPTTSEWEADHLILWTHGGSDDPPNVRPLCIECHKHKTDRDIFNHAKIRRYIKKREQAEEEEYTSRYTRGRKQSVAGSRDTKWARRYNKVKKKFEWQRR